MTTILRIPVLAIKGGVDGEGAAGEIGGDTGSVDGNGGAGEEVGSGTGSVDGEGAAGEIGGGTGLVDANGGAGEKAGGDTGSIDGDGGTGEVAGDSISPDDGVSVMIERGVLGAAGGVATILTGCPGKLTPI